MAKYQGISKSTAVRHGTIAPRRKRSKNEAEEFLHKPKGFEICSTCNSVFFEKSWHHSLDEDTRHLKEKNLDKKQIKFVTCPACQMKKDRVFEGELIIKLDGSQLESKEIINAVNNSNALAMERDPMDRILWIEDRGKEIHIYTSENQLVVRMGKKLESSFKGGKLEIHHSEQEDIIRVYWTAPLI